MKSHPDNAPYESLAVIGMRGRFPGAASVEQFWQNLCGGVESIRSFSEAEMLADGADPAWFALPNFVKAGGVLDDVDMFDAQFFGFSARDAELMDPQHRVFLETAWETLEVAGYNCDTYPGPIGVFAGTEMSQYLFNIFANIHRLGFVDHFQVMVGNDKDHLTTHASYKLNLRGPSVTCQTACSTSLVAVTLACDSLLNYRCDIALAGGVAINLPQHKGYFYQQGGIVSPDGHCRTFDAAARGTVGGNGVALVALKRLSEAIADGDHIHAVIRGAAMNNDGALKAGYTAPGIEGQAKCIAMAQAMAGVHPSTVTYIEAHGTATPLGDPIEVAALTQVFGARTDKKQYCAIGSVKSNVGHLNAAAGVTGLIKAVLAVESGKIPPSLHYREPNPEIDFPNTPFYVQSELADWTASPRRAGVNSFGIGGTNAHVIVEEAPAVGPASPSRRNQLLLLSAATSSALDAATDLLADRLEERPEIHLADVAWTLRVGRKNFNHRRAVVCAGVADAIESLRTRDGLRSFSAMTELRDRPVAFLFPGQGTQYAGMARELYADEAVFREQVDRCCQLLQPPLDLDLREFLFPGPGNLESANQRLRQTSLTQPALFTIEYALAMLWMQWGIRPAAMIGHSIGEYVAACIAGVMPLETALAIVAERGRLMQSMPPGSMLAVPLSEDAVQPFLDEDVSLASVNAPELTVLSGPGEAIERLSRLLDGRGILTRSLHTSHAFHSSMMEGAMRPFTAAVQTADLKAPSLRYISNLTGGWISPEEATNPLYYGRQLRHAVRFADGARTLLENRNTILLEVGPGRTLSTLVRQQLAESTDGAVLLHSLPGAQDEPADQESVLACLGQLWLHGATVDWAGFHAGERRRRVPLPTYPFERQRYWVGEPQADMAPPRDIGNWFYTPAWKQASSPATLSPDATGKGRWLIFADACGLGENLAAKVKEQGATVVTVRPGGEFAAGDRAFTIRADQREDYEALIRELRDRGAMPAVIVHCWSVTAPADAPGLAGFDAHQTTGFHSVVKLVQALEKHKVSDAMQLGIVSNMVQAVLGDEPLCPAKATVLGAAKVIPQEFPNLRCRSIDLAEEDLRDARAADRIVAELTSEPFEPVVAYRRGRRWIQTYDRSPLAPADDDLPPLREHGVYFITGGLGQIGLTLGEVLAKRASARLVLTGRSPFPPRESWDEHLAANPTDGISEKIRRLRRMEELGGEVLVVQADSADAQQMRAAVDAAVEAFGDLHGIVHGAGNTTAEGALSLGQTDEALAAAHFRPKAYGAYLLEEIMADRKVDFCLLLSSLSAVLGGLGFTAYAAGNAFLDAFAAHRNQRSETPCISVNWDAWQFGAEQFAGAASFSDFIRPADGQDAFLRILKLAPRQVVVSASDLQARLDQWVRLETLRPEHPAAAAAPAKHPRPNLASPYVAPRNETEKTIVEAWESLLGISPIGIHDRFFELGGHSLLAIHLISRLRETFQIDLPVQRLFEAPTVAQLADVVAAEIQASRPSDADMEEILRLVKNMSDEEVQALLADHEPDKQAKAALNE